MLKKMITLLLVALVFMIGALIINAAPVHVKQLSYAVEQTSAPPGVVQFQKCEAEYMLNTKLTEHFIMPYKVEVLQSMKETRIEKATFIVFQKIKNIKVSKYQLAENFLENKEALKLNRDCTYDKTYNKLNNMQYRS